MVQDSKISLSIFWRGRKKNHALPTPKAQSLSKSYTVFTQHCEFYTGNFDFQEFLILYSGISNCHCGVLIMYQKEKENDFTFSECTSLYNSKRKTWGSHGRNASVLAENTKDVTVSCQSDCFCYWNTSQWPIFTSILVFFLIGWVLFCFGVGFWFGLVFWFFGGGCLFVLGSLQFFLFVWLVRFDFFVWILLLVAFLSHLLIFHV